MKIDVFPIGAGGFPASHVSLLEGILGEVAKLPSCRVDFEVTKNGWGVTVKSRQMCQRNSGIFVVVLGDFFLSTVEFDWQLMAFSRRKRGLQ